MSNTNTFHSKASDRTGLNEQDKLEQRTKKKIEKLKISQLRKKRIVNKSSIRLTKSMEDLLSKNLNFCPKPSRVDEADLNYSLDKFGSKLIWKEFHSPRIIDSEDEEEPYIMTPLQKLNKGEPKIAHKSREPSINAYIDTVKHDVKNWSKAKPTRDNLTKRERQALNILKNRTDIVVKQANKGGALVIIDSKDYFEEGMRKLNDRNYYQKLDKNPTVDHEKLVNNTIDDLVSGNAIDEDTASLLRPSKSRTPKYYILPKIHKEGMPGRPVVSSVSSPTEKISAFVDEFLKPMAQELPSYIKDTTHFLQKIDKVGEISEDTYMVTLDVKSLYTNIDNEEGLRVFEEELEKRSVKNTPSFAIALLMKLVLILNNFVFNRVNYLQKMGVAMGTRSAPNFSNVFMGYFEKRLFTTANGLKDSLSHGGDI